MNQINIHRDALAGLEVEESFGTQLSMMRRAFMASPLRNLLLWLCFGIFAIIVATAFGQILLNRWNQPFYNAIENRNLSGFLHQLVVFLQIAGGLLVLNVGQSWLNQMLHLKLREGLTRDLITEWMRPRRAFRLANAGAIGVNPDQRLHEDARHLADLSADLGIGLLQASILLVSFVGVLWGLSSGFVFHIGERSFAIPGYMVWAAIIYAGTASCFSWLAGRALIKLNNERYSREAEFRFSLMRVNEHVDAVSLAAGEADEKRRLELGLTTVLKAVRNIIGASIRLTWVTSGYGWITVVAPIVIASPVYFAGDLSFGGLMMAVGAFNQVHASLHWFVANIGGIADWRATLLRVASFRSALLRLDDHRDGENQIRFATTDDGVMILDHVEVASPAGRTKLSEDHVSIGQGERVAVTAAPGAGKTLFFRAVAGLWPWGSGRIELPAGEAVTFVPNMPYFPPGTLREVLCYPLSTSAFDDADIARTLDKVGLERLRGMLDRSARWENDLNSHDQRLLAFARLALHKPRWVVIDEAFDLLQGESRKRVQAVFDDELAGATIINIGKADGAAFPRRLHLTADPEAIPLKPIFRKRNGAKTEASAEKKIRARSLPDTA